MRTYQSIWEEIKKNKRCAIAAPAALHRRIIKAVIQEKWEDKGFKLLAMERRKTTKLKYTTQGNKITFSLVEYTDLKQLATGEL